MENSRLRQLALLDLSILNFGLMSAPLRIDGLKCPPCALRVFAVFGRACSLLCLACLPLLSARGQRNALSRLDVPQQFVVEYEKFDDMEK
jgi:hypothetical protein